MLPANEITDEATLETNPLLKAMKDQRLDYNYVTSLRREVIALIEPYRILTIETAEKLKEQTAAL